MVDPIDTTMWPVTEQSNYTSAEANESSSMYTTESGDDAAGLNETSTAKYPSSTASSLEGLDYKQSKLNLQFSFAALMSVARYKHFIYYFSLTNCSLWKKNVPRSQNRWRSESRVRSLALANLTATVAHINLFAQVRFGSVE